VTRYANYSSVCYAPPARIHQDFEAGKQYVVEEPVIDPGAGDQILMVLSRANLSSGEVTAHYRFLRNGAPTSGPSALTKSGPVFGGGQRNWTRAEFLFACK